MSNKNDKITGCLCAMGCETLFGLSFMFTKSATDSVGGAELLAWRFFIAAVFMSVLVACGAIKINLKGKNPKPLFAVALFCPILYFASETVGVKLTTVTETGVMLASIPIVSLTASSLILHKKPSKRQIIGIAISFTGVIITVLAASMSTSLSIPGYLMLAVCVCAYALYCVYTDKASEFTGAEITYVMILIGAAVFITAAVTVALLNGTMTDLVRAPFDNTGFLVAILYQGIGCSSLAFFLSNMAIARIGVNGLSSFFGLSTVVSILSGVLIMSEAFTGLQLTGAAIIVAGVYLANR